MTFHEQYSDIMDEISKLTIQMAEQLEKLDDLINAVTEKGNFDN